MNEVFRFRMKTLSAKRDGAIAAGETALALRLTDEILEHIERQKILTDRLTGRIPHSE